MRRRRTKVNIHHTRSSHHNYQKLQHKTRKKKTTYNLRHMNIIKMLKQYRTVNYKNILTGIFNGAENEIKITIEKDSYKLIKDHQHFISIKLN